MTTTMAVLPNGTGWACDRPAADAARDGCAHAFATGRGSWRHLLLEAVYGTLAVSDPEYLRVELMQVSHIADAWADEIYKTRMAAS